MKKLATWTIFSILNSLSTASSSCSAKIADAEILTTEAGSLTFLSTNCFDKGFIITRVSCVPLAAEIGDDNNCDSMLAIGTEKKSLIYQEQAKVGQYTIEVGLTSETEQRNRMFKLSVIDGCYNYVPFIQDKTDGELIYEAFAGLVSYADKLYVRPGLEKCFGKSRSTIRCYRDQNFRYRIADCPHFLDFQEEAIGFKLSVDLKKDAMQYGGTKVFFQIVFISDTNDFQKVRSSLTVRGFCEGSQLMHSQIQTKQFSVYAFNRLSWTYDFFIQDPICNTRFGNQFIVKHRCFATATQDDEVACPKELQANGQEASLTKMVGEQARQGGTFYVRAEASQNVIQGQGSVDYILKLIDVCQFSNMQPLQDIPELIVYRVGQKETIELSAGVSNPLCPLTNELISYSLFCQKSGADCQNSPVLNLNTSTGFLKIGNATLDYVADYHIAVLASADKFGSSATINFTLSIQNGCDIFAKVVVLRTIEPIIYLIGTDAQERQLNGLFGLDISFCHGEFIYTVNCLTCWPGTVKMQETSFQVHSTNFRNEGQHTIIIEGHSLVAGVSKTIQVSLEIKKQCKDLEPTIKQLADRLDYTLGQPLPAKFDLFTLTMAEEHCQVIQIAQSEILTIQQKLKPHVSLNGSKLSIKDTSLAQFDLVSRYEVAIALVTSYGHEATIPIEINITDDFCRDQKLEIIVDERVAYDVATGKTNFTSISITKTISECPTQLKLEVTSINNIYIVNHIISDENFNISFLNSDKIGLGNYGLEILASDEVRGTRAQMQQVALTVWDSCAPQQLTIEVVEEVKYDMLYDAVKTIEVLVKKSQQHCPTQLSMLIKCTRNDQIGDCRPLFDLQQPDQANDEQFKIIIDAGPDHLDTYGLTLQAKDNMRNKIVSKVYPIKIDIFDSCQKNMPSLIKPEMTVLEYDLRAKTPVKLLIEAKQAVPDCKSQFELDFTCLDKPFDCQQFQDAMFDVKLLSANTWELSVQTDDFSLQGQNSFDIFAVNGEIGLVSQESISLVIKVFDPCLAQELSMTVDDSVMVTIGPEEGPTVVPIYINASVPKCLSPDARVSILCDGFACQPSFGVFELTKQDKDYFILTFQSKKAELRGSMQISLQVLDEGYDVKTYSVIETIKVQLVDPCMAQQISLIPLSEILTNSNDETVSIDYEILQGLTVYRFNVEPLLPKCPLDLKLTPLCTGKACEVIEFSFDQSALTFAMSVNVNNRSYQSVNSVTLDLADQVNDLHWAWQDYINFAVLDSCSDKLQLRTDFPTEQERVYLGETYSYSVAVQNSQLVKCPINLELEILCEQCDNLITVVKSNDIHSIRVLAVKESQLGEYTIDMVARDIQTGFTTQAQTLSINVIPDCVREKLSYNKQFNTYIRIDNPQRALIVNPYIKSSLISACNAPPIKYKLSGEDGIRFMHLLEQTGELYFIGLEAGEYTLTLEAHSRLNPNVVLSLDLKVFVRDIDFISPFPYNIDMKTGDTSLLVYNQQMVTELRIIDSANGLAFLVNQGSRATRKAMILKTTKEMQPGEYHVLFEINKYYPVAMIVQIGDDLQNSMWLSTQTSIAERWLRDPLGMPMPVARNMVKVTLKTIFVDDSGEIIIDFGEMVNVEDDMPIDKTVLRLSTDPQLNFTWTATLQTGSELLLKLDFKEPELVSPPEQFDFSILRIEFLQSDFFLTTDRLISLVSEGFFIEAPINTPPVEQQVLTVPENDSARNIVIGTIFMLVIINFIGFYTLEDHANKVWLQIDFMQAFSVLSLLAINEGRLDRNDSGFLIDLGYITRLDLYRSIVTKELTREGYNRFDLYSYGQSDQIIWEGLKGPLNLIIVIAFMYFFASLTRIARFHIVGQKTSKKINFASEAFMIWAVDKLLCISQLHFLILAMYVKQAGRHGIESTTIILIFVAHSLARNVFIYLWQGINKGQRSAVKTSKLDSELATLESYRLSVQLSPFTGPYRSNFYAHLDQVIRSAHNFMFSAFITSGSNMMEQIYLIVALEWAHALYYAWCRPFENGSDTVLAMACKVTLIVAVVEQPRPQLALAMFMLFVFTHLGQIGQRLRTKINEWREKRKEVKVYNDESAIDQSKNRTDGLGSQQMLEDSDKHDGSDLGIVEEVSIGDEEEDEGLDQNFINRRRSRMKLVRNVENRSQQATQMHGNMPEMMQVEENQSILLRDSQMKVQRYTVPDYESGRKRRNFYLPSEEDSIDLELRSEQRIADGKPGHMSPDGGMMLTKTRSKSVIAPDLGGPDYNPGPFITINTSYKKPQEPFKSVEPLQDYEISQDLSEYESQSHQDKNDGIRSRNTYQDRLGLRTVTHDSSITAKKDNSKATPKRSQRPTEVFLSLRNSQQETQRSLQADKEALSIQNRRKKTLDRIAQRQQDYTQNTQVRDLDRYHNSGIDSIEKLEEVDASQERNLRGRVQEDQLSNVLQSYRANDSAGK